ncbi:MAG TPA: glycosyltransferase [Steroidobacteraceae bacterium]|nr:glycosyltransferase [Steroidobacteraceae bacterium]
MTDGSRRVVQVCSIGLMARQFLTDHMRGMQAAGFEVTLACCDDADSRAAIEASGAQFEPVTIKQGLDPAADLLAVIRLFRVLRRIGPMIVDVHGSKAGIVAMMASWMARVPIRIYHNHGMALLSATGLKRVMLRAVEWISCSLATRVIYVAPSNLTDAVRAGVCNESKSTVLGPGTISGIRASTFDPTQNRARGLELRRMIGIPGDSALCGFVGRIVPHKGIETALQAWRLLPAAVRESAYLCIFGTLGTRPMYALVEEAVSQPDLHVKYLGFSDEMPSWYATMDLLIQASWHEGWGYNVLEAACSGVPAVGTRISATVDAILDGETGLLVPVRNPTAMATAIAQLLTDAALRQRLGQAARARSLREFRAEDICPLLLNEYWSLLHGLQASRG